MHQKRLPGRQALFCLPSVLRFVKRVTPMAAWTLPGLAWAQGPSGPALAPTDGLDGADTAWVMVSTALVVLMTLPGIALFYGGMVRRFNVINTLASVVAIAALVSLLWFALGYSLAFTPGGALGGFIGGLDRIGFAGLDYLGTTGQVAVSRRRLPTSLRPAPRSPSSAAAMPVPRSSFWTRSIASGPRPRLTSSSPIPALRPTMPPSASAAAR